MMIGETATRNPSIARTEQWRAELGSAFRGLHPEALGEGSIEGHLTGRQLGSTGVYRITGTPQIVRRTPQSLRDADGDPLKICVQQRGRAIVRQGRWQVVLDPGMVAIYDTGRPYEIELAPAWSSAVITVPRHGLGVPERTLTAIMEHPIHRDTGAAAVLAAFVDSAVRQADSLEEGAADRLGEAGVQLVASALCAAQPDEDQAGQDAQRMLVLRYVRQHLSDPHLTHARVAAAHGMAPRTLHRMFEHEAFTVTEHIRSLRLEAVLRDLRDPAYANRSIMAVAARWCFVDPSHFTRAFRAQFGTTPTLARRGGPDEQAER